MINIDIDNHVTPSGDGSVTPNSSKGNSSDYLSVKMEDHETKRKIPSLDAMSGGRLKGTFTFNSNSIPRPSSEIAESRKYKGHDPAAHYMSYETVAAVVQNMPIRKENLYRDPIANVVSSGSSNKVNNNNDETQRMETKVTLFNKHMSNYDSTNWKDRQSADYGDLEDFRRQFPWKRIAYIGMLLMLGITCAILVLMKLCGGAEWMNRATFSVIIMGTIMLLPPGLYYGRILVCVTCGCGGYTPWDLPAGPFG